MNCKPGKLAVFVKPLGVIDNLTGKRVAEIDLCGHVVTTVRLETVSHWIIDPPQKVKVDAPGVGSLNLLLVSIGDDYLRPLLGVPGADGYTWENSFGYQFWGKAPPATGAYNIEPLFKRAAQAERDTTFDHLAGRGMHELRTDELPAYLVAIGVNHGPSSAAFIEAATWVAGELARKTNDEMVIAAKLATLMEPAAALPARFVQVGMFTNKVERSRCIWWDGVAHPEGTPIYIAAPAAQAERPEPDYKTMYEELAQDTADKYHAGLEALAEPVVLPAEPVATLSYTPVIAGLPVLRLTELGRRWVQGGVFSLYAAQAAQAERPNLAYLAGYAAAQHDSAQESTKPVAWKWELLPESKRNKNKGEKSGVYLVDPASFDVDISSEGQRAHYKWTLLYASPQTAPEPAEPVALPVKFHPQASHINPDYRDGYNQAIDDAMAALAAKGQA